MYFVLFYCSLYGLLVFNVTLCTFVYSHNNILGIVQPFHYENMLTNNISKEFGILDSNGPPKIPSQPSVAARGCYNFFSMQRAHYYFNTRHIDDPSYLLVYIIRATKPLNLWIPRSLGGGGVYRKEGNCLSIAIFVVFPNVNQLFPIRHCQHYVAISLWPNSVMEGNRFPWENHWLSVNTLRK